MEKVTKSIGTFDAKDVLLLMGGAAALFFTYRHWNDDKKLLKDVVQILTEERRGRSLSRVRSDSLDNSPEKNNPPIEALHTERSKMSTKNKKYNIEKQHISRILFTGGPCAGKTTALAEVQADLQ